MSARRRRCSGPAPTTEHLSLLVAQGEISEKDRHAIEQFRDLLAVLGPRPDPRLRHAVDTLPL